MRTVGLAGTASYLPQRWMTAREISERSDIPESILVERFGLTGKHIAASDEHVSDMAVTAAGKLLAETGTDPDEIDAVVYFGSSWKDYQVWQAAPWIAHRLGASRAFALELDYVSCGSPVALRVGRDLLRAEPELRKLLLVAASKESQLLDYENERARFMFNFGDGAVAALLEGDQTEHQILGAHILTDGSFSLDVKVPGGGSVEPPSHRSVDARRHYLDVEDPLSMKERLDGVSLSNFVAAADGALERSGASREDVGLVCGIHMKRSMHEALLAGLGVDSHQAMYLEDTGHMSGVDPLLALDRAARTGRVSPGDLVLLIAAGTGYTWAATCIRWGTAV